MVCELSNSTVCCQLRSLVPEKMGSKKCWSGSPSKRVQNKKSLELCPYVNYHHPLTYLPIYVPTQGQKKKLDWNKIIMLPRVGSNHQPLDDLYVITVERASQLRHEGI